MKTKKYYTSLEDSQLNYDSRDGDDHNFIHPENKVIYGKKGTLVPDCNTLAYRKGKYSLTCRQTSPNTE